MVSWFFIVFDWFPCVFKVVSLFFHGFWLVSMLFQGGFMVFHVFLLVSMVFQGSFMVFKGGFMALSSKSMSFPGIQMREASKQTDYLHIT